MSDLVVREYVERRPGRLGRFIGSVFKYFVPSARGASWQWYRQACGGRWTPYWTRKIGEERWVGPAWHLSPQCSLTTEPQAPRPPHVNNQPYSVTGSGCWITGVCQCEVW